MKYILILLALTFSTAKAQTALNFEKYTLDAENKWVAFPMAKDSTYAFGFIYIDLTAGLTLNYEGKFKINDAHKFEVTKPTTSTTKIRLQANNMKVAIIPEGWFSELKIKAEPDWLKIYKSDSSSVAWLFRRGFINNGWNRCDVALNYLEKANQKDASFSGLAVELAFSYNCLKQYDKAVSVLQKELKRVPTDAYVNKELIYAEVHSGQLEQASASCKNAIAICADKTYHGENCYNVLQGYFFKKDKIQFSAWLDETKKWGANNANLLANVKKMEEEMVK